MHSRAKGAGEEEGIVQSILHGCVGGCRLYKVLLGHDLGSHFEMRSSFWINTLAGHSAKKKWWEECTAVWWGISCLCGNSSVYAAFLIRFNPACMFCMHVYACLYACVHVFAHVHVGVEVRGHLHSLFHFVL